ncbi:hypothetical protein OHA21_07735 [Actinoplanes sp. NBC_00393]|uniref:hypothetical protein n=1 Tax=Actinoplanes sp. NBC_00393 TaxID=2975953 RepID=UPI002E1C66D0
MDDTRELRWSVGLFLAFLAIVPMLGPALAAAEAEAARAWIPVLIAAPVNLAGVLIAAVAMRTRDPVLSTRRLSVAAALVLVGDLALYSAR